MKLKIWILILIILLAASASLFAAAFGLLTPSYNQSFAQTPVKLHMIATANFSFEGGGKFKSPVYMDACRYYFSLEDFASVLGAACRRDENRFVITYNGADYTFDLEKTFCRLSSGAYIPLVDAPVETNGKIYTCMSNLARAFDLVTSWDLKNNAVCFFFNRRQVAHGKQAAVNGNTAYLRLEDIYCDGENTGENADKLLKLRAMSDLLYENGIPFHIAWIPRCVIPAKNIDNDPETMWGIANADYIYTLDYMQFRGGSVGLHGYTHANGDKATSVGQDFGPNLNTTEANAQNQMNLAKNAADNLKIPYSFFEFPHYAATKTQLDVAEKNFKVIYQKYVLDGNKNDLCTVNGALFVATPLDYVINAGSVDAFLKSADSLLSKGVLGSFFFHLSIENAYIGPIKTSDGYSEYSYQNNSPLQRILELFRKKNYTFRYVYEAIGKN